MLLKMRPENEAQTGSLYKPALTAPLVATPIPFGDQVLAARPHGVSPGLEADVFSLLQNLPPMGQPRRCPICSVRHPPPGHHGTLQSLMAPILWGGCLQYGKLVEGTGHQPLLYYPNKAGKARSTSGALSAGGIPQFQLVHLVVLYPPRIIDALRHSFRCRVPEGALFGSV